jgi:hypothetical protein
LPLEKCRKLSETISADPDKGKIAAKDVFGVMGAAGLIERDRIGQYWRAASPKPPVRYRGRKERKV